MNHELSRAIKHWQYVAPIIRYPHNEQQLEKMIAQLDQLLDLVGNDENHPLIELVDILSGIIETYEIQEEKKIMGTGLDALKYLMQAHHLAQSDLSEIASQGVLSEILNGKRKLNLRQIKLLAKRFDIDPATFIDN